MDHQIQVDVLYLNFQKAFNKVDNNILLQKLELIGCASKLVKLFVDYQATVLNLSGLDVMILSLTTPGQVSVRGHVSGRYCFPLW